MSRKKFRMAPDAARRRIVCDNFEFNGGAPYCKALTHPWCLAPGESMATCRFVKPPEPKKDESRTPDESLPRKKKKKPTAPEGDGDGEAD